MRKAIIAVSLVVFFVSSSFALDNVVTAVGDPWPPFGDPGRPSKGLSVEIVRSAMEVQGYDLQMSFMPWARAEDGVRKGTYDFLIYVWKTEERKSAMIYSDSYCENRLTFFKLNEDDFEFNGMNSLKGLTIGVVRDYGYGDEFMKAQGFKREPALDFMTNVKKLAAGRIDLTVEDEVVARSMLLGTDLEDKVVQTDNALSVEPLYVTSGLVNPRGKELIEAFNKGLIEIKRNGTYDLILENYGLK